MIDDDDKSNSDTDDEDIENQPPTNRELKNPLHILALLNRCSSRVQGLREMADQQNKMYKELMKKHNPNARYPFALEASLPKKYDEDFHCSAKNTLSGKDSLTGPLVSYNALVRHVEKVQRQILNVDDKAAIPVFNKTHKSAIKLSECSIFSDPAKDDNLGLEKVREKKYIPSNRVPGK